ncbi:hypothetical protein THASP1DRAFT_26284, partial [Thamnocephalis sphaerospora]
GLAAGGHLGGLAAGVDGGALASGLAGGAHDGTDRTPGRRRRRRGANADGTPIARRGGGAGGTGGGNANPFFAFCQKERATVRAVMPDATNGEITRELGQRWRALTSDEKKVFYDIAEQQRAERAAAAAAAAELGTGETEVEDADSAVKPDPETGGEHDTTAIPADSLGAHDPENEELSWSDDLSTTTTSDDDENTTRDRDMLAGDDDDDEDIEEGADDMDDAEPAVASRIVTDSQPGHVDPSLMPVDTD